LKIEPKPEIEMTVIEETPKIGEPEVVEKAKAEKPKDDNAIEVTIEVEEPAVDEQVDMIKVEEIIEDERKVAEKKEEEKPTTVEEPHLEGIQICINDQEKQHFGDFKLDVTLTVEKTKTDAIVLVEKPTVEEKPKADDPGKVAEKKEEETPRVEDPKLVKVQESSKDQEKQKTEELNLEVILKVGEDKADEKLKD
jgi:hypothetical protein